MNWNKLETQRTLQAVTNFSQELQATSSSNEKIEIIKSYSQNKWLCQVLQYVYSPYIQFGVTSDNCKKRHDLCDSDDLYLLFDLLDDLSNRVLTGHAAISAVNGFVLANKKYENIIYNIIDKDLKTRAGASLINKAIPGLIPQFKVALAEAIKDMPDFENEEWFDIFVVKSRELVSTIWVARRNRLVRMRKVCSCCVRMGICFDKVINFCSV